MPAETEADAEDEPSPEALVDALVEDPTRALGSETETDHDAGQHTQFVRYAGEDEAGHQEFEVSMLSARFPTKGERITDIYSRQIVEDWVAKNDVTEVPVERAEGLPGSGASHVV